MSSKSTKTPKTVMRLDVWLSGDDGEPVLHEVTAGARERIETSRHLGEPMLARAKAGDEEAIAYMGWCALRNAGKFEGNFDSFLARLVEVGIDDEEDTAGGR